MQVASCMKSNSCQICFSLSLLVRLRVLTPCASRQYNLTSTPLLLGWERERVRHLKFEMGKESEKLSATLGRCLSLLFDWGAESGVWKSPSAFIRDALPFDTLFGMSLPLPDADHALHHVATKTSKFIYFHIRHLMKILVVILTYHRSHFYLFSLIFT